MSKVGELARTCIGLVMRMEGRETGVKSMTSLAMESFYSCSGTAFEAYVRAIVV